MIRAIGEEAYPMSELEHSSGSLRGGEMIVFCFGH